MALVWNGGGWVGGSVTESMGFKGWASMVIEKLCTWHATPENRASQPDLSLSLEAQHVVGRKGRSA